VRPVAARGRLLWGVAGLAVTAALAIPGGWLITFAGVHQGLPPQRTVTRVFTVSQPVTTLNVQSSGAPVQVTAGPVHQVQITEAISYDPQQSGLPAAAAPSVSDGILTLGEADCQEYPDCSIGFAVTVPPGVGVAAETQGGSLTVSGASGANLDSGGANVVAQGITGHLIVTTGGGSLAVSGLNGPLVADTGGGPLLARGIDAAATTVITDGGGAWIRFAAVPDGVFVSTEGGPATLTVPGGPYALIASTYGAPESVRIATDPAASRSITVTTGGGPLQVKPPGQ
jgi:hypothetical protein